MGEPRDGGESRDKQSHERRAALSHPLRRRIARRIADGREASLLELAAELREPRGRVAYHLAVLVKHRALQVAPRQDSAPPRYRWGAEAQWARELLAEDEKDA
jgi:DNA-binding transcriptional ArsR family regulator